MKLVFIENNRPVTDSLMVAHSFGKEHRRVLQDIRELGCSEDFRMHHFVHTPYVHHQNGQTYEKCIMTQEGFAFLAFGYTGKDADRFKEDYINEFVRMRDELNGPSDIEKFLYNPDTIIKLAQNWKEEKELRLIAEAKIDEDRPKVVFAEALETSRDSILVSDLAKLLKQNGIDTGEQRLFRWLRENGYLIKGGSEYNMPTQRSMDLKIMEIKVGQRASATEGFKQTRTPKITGKGQIYFINKFKTILNLPA